MFHDNKNTLENTQKIPSTSRKVQSQQVARSAFSLSTPFNYRFIRERHKKAFSTDVINSFESLTYRSTTSLPFEKRFNVFSKSSN